LSLPPILSGQRLPVIAAPMFIVSNPALVIAQCTAGVVGSFPALNARPASQLDEWIHEITEALAAWDRDHPERPAAPFAVNQIVHRSNDRLDHDMAVCARWKVPIVISSLGARVEINQAVHDWGGITLHDVIDDRFARKAIEKGADGASGWSRSQAASASVTSCSHSSRREAGRALSAGKLPTIPAVHWAMTSAGLEMMNIGAATTGSRRFVKIGGRLKSGDTPGTTRRTAALPRRSSWPE
jgi:hypothetical protein